MRTNYALRFPLTNEWTAVRVLVDASAAFTCFDEKRWLDVGNVTGKRGDGATALRAAAVKAGLLDAKDRRALIFLDMLP